jgi:phosphoribosylformimino-5-aminoimidazole carboxamide ribotide isomerase
MESLKVMIFFPAIDLKGGQCVRLLRGDMNKATVFSDDAGAQGSVFASSGCEWIHVVDLNGAFEGRPVNGAAVRSILEAVNIPVQLGGGIRDMETIAYWQEAGVARVILGTAALRNPGLVQRACKEFPGQVAVGIDAQNGLVAVEGWAKVSEMSACDLALRYEDAGVAAIIYTDISRDGAMQGPNIEATKALAEAISTPVIVSGGVSSMADLKALKDASQDTFEGVISGRAVYDGAIDPGAATQFLKG